MEGHYRKQDWREKNKREVSRLRTEVREELR